MKQRILSAAVGVSLFITVMFLNDVPYILNIVISMISVMAIWELFVATRYVQNKPLLIISLIFTAFVPFFRDPYFNIASKTAIFIFVFLLLIVMILDQGIHIEQTGFVFMLCTLVPFSFSSLIYLRDLPHDASLHLERLDGVFLLLLAAIGAWINDTGAFFIGRTLGKHKLAPKISPQKTVEGLIGGIVFDIVGFLLAAWIYTKLVPGVKINVVLLILLAIVCAGAGTMGDLAASSIKRSCHIKDFGKIMPGHGGVLDRFDSMLLVAPMLYVLIQIFQPIWPFIWR